MSLQSYRANLEAFLTSEFDSNDVEDAFIANKSIHCNSLYSYFEGASYQHSIDAAIIRKLANDLIVAVEALEKGTAIIVEDTCDECGTFLGVRYEIKPIVEALEKLTNGAV